MKTGLHIDKKGTQYWYVNGKFHREDGPAIIWQDGTQFWYQYGKRHRTDGPAIINRSGSQFWYLNGQFISTTQTDFKNYLIKENLNKIL